MNVNTEDSICDFVRQGYMAAKLVHVAKVMKYLVPCVRYNTKVGTRVHNDWFIFLFICAADIYLGVCTSANDIHMLDNTS